MANNPFFSDAYVVGGMNAGTSLLNSGFMYIYSGSQPGDANQPVTGTLLAKLPLSATAFQGASASGIDGLQAPAAPVPTTVASGGTVANGVYTAAVSYVNAAGESVGSLTGTVTTTGTNISTITIPSPPALSNATGWYAYVSQVNLTTLTRQQSPGSPTAIGTNLTLNAPPSSGGLNPQGTNTTSTRIVTAVANAISSAAALATGTAGYWALMKSDGVTPVVMGDVATSGADLNLNAVAFTSGQLVSVSSFTLTQVE